MIQSFVIAQEIHHYWTAFVRLIYPEVCLLCSGSLEIQDCYICGPCIHKIETLKPPLCPKCAMQIPPYLSKMSRCPSCQNMKTHFDRGYALFPYQNEIKKILHSVKFSKKSWHLKALDPFLNDLTMPPIFDYDFLVPVPLDPIRKRQREFNQSHLIARLIHQHDNSSPIRSVLKKVKRTEPQSALDRSRRLENLGNAFKLRRGSKVSGKKILLIDDIVTTGATVNECAKCLKEKGALKVDFFALARTIF